MFNRLILVLGLCTFFGLSSAYAEMPRASSMEECSAFADMALVAGALAKHKVHRETTDKVLENIYMVQTESHKKIQKAVVDEAFRNPPAVPGNYAAKIGTECVTTGGFFRSIMGKDI